MASCVPPPTDHDFDIFAAAVRRSLVQRAQWIVRDPDEAEDIAQDTLTAMWQLWTTTPPRNPEAHAHRAVSLNAIKRLTRARVHNQID